MLAVIVGDRKNEHRWKKTVAILRRFPYLTLKHSPAVYVTDKDVKEGKTLTKGECGALLAHRQVWQTYYESGNDDPILIFEDDLIASASYEETTRFIKREYEKLARGEQEIAWIGWHMIPSRYDKRRRQKIRANLYTGTYAYMINRRGVKILLETIPPRCHQLPVDVVLSRMVEQKHLRGGSDDWSVLKGKYRGVFLPDISQTTIGKRTMLRKLVDGLGIIN